MAQSMNAVVIPRFGDPGVLELRQVPRPEPGPDEIRVKVRASGLNRADLSQRRGRYPAPPDSPRDIPGLEYSGVVETVGTEVERWRIGDPVMGIVGGGGYAEYLVTPAEAAVRVPRSLTVEDAGAIPEVFMTAWDALFDQVGLQAGETLLIHAVGSGVGTAAVQLARDAGARTLGTARSPEKIVRALDLGLSVGFVAERDWPQRILEATDGRGVDAVLDLVGGAYLPGNQEVMASGGRHIVVGTPAGGRAEVDLRLLMGRRATIRGTVLRARPREEKLALARRFEAAVVPRFESGDLAPVLDRTFPAEDVSAAHGWMEENRNFGKILLLWD